MPVRRLCGCVGNFFYKMIWKKHKDYPMYLISNTGLIKSLNYKNSGKEQVLKPAKDKGGYYRTMLKHKSGKIGIIKVHRIVCQAFNNNPDNKPEVNHIDYDRTNNNSSNLEWVTRIENVKHSKCNMIGLIGEKNPAATITEKEVIEIRKIYPFGRNSIKKGEISKRQLAEKYNVSVYCLKNIVTNKTWKHLL